MGVKDGSKIFHKLDGIRLPQLSTILRNVMSQSPVQDAPRNPCVAIDGNWISNKVNSSPVRLLELCGCFVDQEIDVVIVFDGDSRHHSKRDSVRRSADREKARIKAIEARTAVMQLRDGGISNDVERDMEKKLTTTLKSKETQSLGGSNNRFHPQFVAGVSELVEKRNDSCIQVQVATTQADQILAKLVLDGIADAIIGNDGDFPVYIGGSGVSIKQFNYDSRKKLFKWFTLSSGYYSAIQQAAKSVNISEEKIARAEYPLIDGHDSPRYRCGVAVCLGNDTCVGGIPNVAAARLNDIIKEGNCAGDADKLLAAVKEKAKVKKDADGASVLDVLDVFVDAMMYEPANLLGHEGPNNYLWKPTKPLPRYLEGWAEEGDEIVDGPNMLECAGHSDCGAGTHLFLAAEGHFSCCIEDCSKLLCRFCYMNSDDKKQKFCCGCYVEDCVDASYDGPTIEEMRSQLEPYDKSNLAANLSYLELKEYYQTVCVERKFAKLEEAITSIVTFPTKPTGALKDEEQISTIMPFDFCDGGRFLSDPRLTDQQVVGVIHILGSLVKFSRDSDVPIPTEKKEYAVHDVVPTLVRKFAEASRADEGIHILKRAVRHAFDPRTPSLLGSQGKVCTCDDEIALVLSCAVHASMKDDDYDGAVAFTQNALIAASCECDSGPTEDDDQHICIHVMAKIYKLVLLLFDCLAEHSLCELVCRYGKADPEFESPAARERFYDSIKLLIEACHCTPGAVLEATTLAEYLSEFNVGTEKQKMAPKPPNPKDVGPLKNFEFKSPVGKAKEAIGNSRVKVETVSAEDDDDDDSTYCPSLQASDETSLSDDSVCPSLRMRDQDSLSNDDSLSECSFIEPDDEREPDPSYMLIDAAAAAIEPALQDYLRGQGLSADEISHYFADAGDKDFVGNKLLELRSRSAEMDGGAARAKLSQAFENDWKETFSRSETRKEKRGGFRPKKRKVSNDESVVEVDDLDGSDEENHLSEEENDTMPDEPSNGLANKENEETTQQKPFLEEGPRKSTSKPKRKRGNGHKCAIINCPHTDCNTFVMAPTRPKPLPENASNQRRKTFAEKTRGHEKYLDCCGWEWCDILKTEPGVDIRICSEHAKTLADVSVTVLYDTEERSKDGSITVDTKSSTFVRKYPSAVGRKSSRAAPSTDSRGNALDRRNRRELQTLKQAIHESVNPVPAQSGPPRRKPKSRKVARKRRNEAKWRYPTREKRDVTLSADAMQSLLFANIQQNALDDVESVLEINASVRKEAGLDVHEATAAPILTEIPSRPPPRKKGRRNNPKKRKSPASRKPVQVVDLTSEAVRERTGFKDLVSLLVFCLVACNGDMELFNMTVSSLTPLEEWLLYFEVVYGHASKRKVDKKREFGIDRKRISKILREKVDLVKRAKSLWPTYATFEEDKALRDPKWNERYADERIIFWDNTGIEMPKPSDPEMQRRTWSSYYHANVAKGGVAIQLCGWLNTIDLWMGAISDTEYFEKGGILEEQQQFALVDLVSGKEIPFTNVLDRGYRCDRAAWRKGKQLILQPIFKPSDRKFNTREVLFSAAVAADRSGNERGVKIVKHSSFLKDGLHQRTDVAFFCDVWLAFAFQANFMYKSVM